MASKAAVAKNLKQQIKLKKGNSKFQSVKYRNRCANCGRSRGYIGRFKLCRVCFRKMALNGDLPGVRKMTW